MSRRFTAFVAFVFLSRACGTGAALAATGLTVPHPDDPSKQVEYFMEKPAGKAPWPTVVLIHGHQEGQRTGARDWVDPGFLKDLASRGYLAVAVSQPGYGNSSGPSDFGGPSSQHAVTAVIARLKAEGLVAPHKLLLEGVSLGAVVAGMVAAQDPSVTALALVSGIYDFRPWVTDPQPSPMRRQVLEGISSETGGNTPEAMTARSVLTVANRIKVTALILNGAKDELADAALSRSLADVIIKNGGKARVIIYPDFAHNIPFEARNKDVDPFIDRVLAGR